MLEMSLYCTFGNSLFLRHSATLSSVASLSHVYVKFKVYSVNTSNEETRALPKSTGMAYAQNGVVPFPLATHGSRKWSTRANLARKVEKPSPYPLRRTGSAAKPLSSAADHADYS